MPKQRKPFELTVEYVETPDAQERLDKAYAIILKAGRRKLCPRHGLPSASE